MAALTAKPDSSIFNGKCKESIETSYPLFVIHTNNVTTIPDESLFNLSQRVFDAALQRFAFKDPQNVLSLRRILSAVFDTDHRAFVLEGSDRILAAVLDADSKGCIFAQAIAGMLMILRAVAQDCPKGDEEVTPAQFDMAIRNFQASDKRASMLARIEHSPVWGNCFQKANIGDMIMEAMDGEALAAEEKKHEPVGAAVSVVEVAVNDEDVTSQLFDDGPHLNRNLGVPDKFTIMALN